MLSRDFLPPMPTPPPMPVFDSEPESEDESEDEWEDELDDGTHCVRYFAPPPGSCYMNLEPMVVETWSELPPVLDDVPRIVVDKIDRTLCIGNLAPWQDERFLRKQFIPYVRVMLSIEVIHNKHTKQTEGYGYVEFYERLQAEAFLREMHASRPGFSLKWASFTKSDRHSVNDSHSQIFIRGLAEQVTGDMLKETFAKKYPSVRGAEAGLRSPSDSFLYGYVWFGDDNERDRAICEMDGQDCSGMPMDISVATPRTSQGSTIFTRMIDFGQMMKKPLRRRPEQIEMTLCVGNLSIWVDEDYLQDCFRPHSKEVRSICLIRNKHTQEAEGYAYVEFCSREAAKNVLLSYHETRMPRSKTFWCLKWASFTNCDRHSVDNSYSQIFVSPLAEKVTDDVLKSTFAEKYSSVRGAEISKSYHYGKVWFGDDDERDRAICEMDGEYCCGMAMTIRVAGHRTFSER